MEITIPEAAAFLRERDKFLILNHFKPDGDAVGSAAALCRSLQELGKTAWILPNPEITEKFQPFVADLTAPADYQPAYVVTVDTASVPILQVNAGAYAQRVDLALDHHPSNTGYAQRSCVDAKRAACGELIYDVIRALGPVTQKTAEALYVALSTDTGCFCYGNTTAATLRTAADLIDLGANNAALNKQFHRTKTRGRMALEGAILNGMAYFRGGQVAVSTVTLQMMADAGVTENDMDDVAAIPGQIEGVLVSITIRETEDHGAKISIRTAGDLCPVSANDIGAKLGGGGHKSAAGCRVDGDVETAKEKILQAIDQVWAAV